MTVGFAAIARPTFDVEFAASKAHEAYEATTRAYAEVAGNADLLMDIEAVSRVAESMPELDSMVVFQATFADSTLIAALDEALQVPLLLWATPEPRSGGRLRLNSFCGINLAGYVLARRNRSYAWLLTDPAEDDAPRLLTHSGAAEGSAPPPPDPSRIAAPVSLSGSVVGVVGDRPGGFEPCDYDPARLHELTGVSVDRVELADLFGAADRATDDDVAATTSKFGEELDGLEKQDSAATKKSVRLHLGMKQLANDRSWAGIATRCWPECFTEYGGAACAPMSLLTSDGIPGTCEADVYGNVTSLLLSSIAGEPAFVADLVDIDPATDTVVFWHCGLAPIEMAGPQLAPEAAVHSNREKPLLYQFALKQGPVTIARLSQSQNEHRLVVGKAEMIADPPAFTGTSGVARVDDAGKMLDRILGNGLEHHYGLVYGDHTDQLRAYAASIGIELVELT